jgi:hypothetical protein
VSLRNLSKHPRGFGCFVAAAQHATVKTPISLTGFDVHRTLRIAAVDVAVGRKAPLQGVASGGPKSARWPSFNIEPQNRLHRPKRASIEALADPREGRIARLQRQRREGAESGPSAASHEGHRT